MKFFLLFVFFGCSHVQYVSTDKTTMFFSSEPGQYRAFEKQGEIDFYVFGQFPRKNRVYIDDVLVSEGENSIYNMEIEEFLSPMNIFYSVVSLGLYTPRSYKLRGYVK